MLPAKAGAHAVTVDDPRQIGDARLAAKNRPGHAKTGVGYGDWLHGEAVAAGICMAADLSRRQGWLSGEEQERIVRLIRRAKLPDQPPQQLNRERLLSLMAVDKKVLNGKIRLVLPKGLGNSLVTENYDPEKLNHTLDG